MLTTECSFIYLIWPRVMLETVWPPVKLQLSPELEVGTTRMTTLKAAHNLLQRWTRRHTNPLLLKLSGEKTPFKIPKCYPMVSLSTRSGGLSSAKHAALGLLLIGLMLISAKT